MSPTASPFLHALHQVALAVARSHYTVTSPSLLLQSSFYGVGYAASVGAAAMAAGSCCQLASFSNKAVVSKLDFSFFHQILLVTLTKTN